MKNYRSDTTNTEVENKFKNTNTTRTEKLLVQICPVVTEQSREKCRDVFRMSY